VGEKTGGGETEKKKEKKKDKSPFHLRFAARRDGKQNQQPGPANVLIKATRNISILRVPYADIIVSLRRNILFLSEDGKCFRTFEKYLLVQETCFSQLEGETRFSTAIALPYMPVYEAIFGFAAFALIKALGILRGLYGSDFRSRYSLSLFVCYE